MKIVSLSISKKKGTRKTAVDEAKLTALVEITQIGKECKKKCAIFYQAGDCIMPREGVFAKVLQGGIIRRGDSIEMITAETS